MDGTTLDAEVIRRALGTLISPAGGIVTPGDLAVAQQTVPNMSVQIGTGQVWVPGTSTATQGPYYSRNGAAITQAINAASVSNPRVDIVGVQVGDIAYAGAAKQIAPFYVAGTPTAGATLVNLAGIGAVPASSLVLAYVLVPTNATSIVTADISAMIAPVCGHATGSWQTLSYATGVEAADTFYGFGTGFTPSARLEGDVVRLKGELYNSGSTIGINATIATLPSSAMFPAERVRAVVHSNLVPTVLAVSSSGLISTQAAFGTLTVMNLDGVAFTLT